MPDSSMTPPAPGPDIPISQGDRVVFTISDDFAPGDIVCAALFNPSRMVCRVYQEITHNSVGEPCRAIARLLPLNPAYEVETIASETDGVILGRAVDVLSVRRVAPNPEALAPALPSLH